MNIFPSIELADEYGFLSVNDDLSISTLIEAYENGIFPWPFLDDGPITWFAPNPRGILFIKDFYISKSLKKFLKKDLYTVTFNNSFSEVITNCSKVKRSGQSKKDKWLIDRLINAYIDLYNTNLAYSVEVYLDKKLVGGLYGTIINNVVSAESMFFIESNASKVALNALVSHLRKKNIYWIDIQMVSETLQKLGGIDITRNEFMHLVELAHKKNRINLFNN